MYSHKKAKLCVNEGEIAAFNLTLIFTKDLAEKQFKAALALILRRQRIWISLPRLQSLDGYQSVKSSQHTNTTFYPFYLKTHQIFSKRNLLVRGDFHLMLFAFTQRKAQSENEVKSSPEDHLYIHKIYLLFVF